MRIYLITFILLLASFHSSGQQNDTSADSAGSKVIDSTELYGFIPERPIKVGGGPAEQRKYLEQLRDAQGKKISYQRKFSCCPYDTDSPKAMFGGGMLDAYEIKYLDSDNKKQQVLVYITFYDFEEPRAIKGFTFNK